MSFTDEEIKTAKDNLTKTFREHPDPRTGQKLNGRQIEERVSQMIERTDKKQEEIKK